MKTLIVYYSLTGMNKKVAELLAKELGADLEGIRTVEELDPKKGLAMPKTVLFGFLGMLPKIRPAERDPSKYDLVVLGGPIWTGRLADPMKAYLRENAGKFPQKVGLFICCGGCSKEDDKFLDGMGLSEKKCMDEMERLSGRRALARLVLKEKDDMESGAYGKKVKEFAASLKKMS